VKKKKKPSTKPAPRDRTRRPMSISFRPEVLAALDAQAKKDAQPYGVPNRSQVIEKALRAYLKMSTQWRHGVLGETGVDDPHKKYPTAKPRRKGWGASAR